MFFFRIEHEIPISAKCQLGNLLAQFFVNKEKTNLIRNELFDLLLMPLTKTSAENIHHHIWTGKFRRAFGSKSDLRAFFDKTISKYNPKKANNLKNLPSAINSVLKALNKKRSNLKMQLNLHNLVDLTPFVARIGKENFSFLEEKKLASY